VTRAPDKPDQDGDSGRSLLPEPDLGLRVRQADFARIVGVSRTTVTRWAKSGVITVGPDGLLDPRRAARQVLDHVDPVRLRAPVLRPLVNDQRALRAQIDELKSERDELRAEVERLRAAVAMQADDIEALEQYAPPEMRGADDDEDDHDDGGDNDEDNEQPS